MRKICVADIVLPADSRGSDRIQFAFCVRITVFGDSAFLPRSPLSKSDKSKLMKLLPPLLYPILLTGLTSVVCLTLPRLWSEPSSEVSPAPFDAIQDAQTPREIPLERPEQKKNAHDLSDVFSATKAEPSSTAFKDQPEQGQTQGFDFYRDPPDAKKPMQNFEETMQADIEAKPKVMETQRKLLESRYNLTPRLDPEAKMFRGKPLVVGPTAKLPAGVDWDSLTKMSPEEIKKAGIFPYPSLPHPKQQPGGQVFPQVQIAMFSRLQRFDVDFDLPEAFLPEFPPAIFLQSRPELGDVSRGEVVSINNYYRLFKDILTPVQLDGLRLLLTPFPQESLIPLMTGKALTLPLELPVWTVMLMGTPLVSFTSTRIFAQSNGVSVWTQ